MHQTRKMTSSVSPAIFQDKSIHFYRFIIAIHSRILSHNPIFCRSTRQNSLHLEYACNSPVYMTFLVTVTASDRTQRHTPNCCIQQKSDGPRRSIISSSTMAVAKTGTLSRRGRVPNFYKRFFETVEYESLIERAIISFGVIGWCPYQLVKILRTNHAGRTGRRNANRGLGTLSRDSINARFLSSG